MTEELKEETRVLLGQIWDIMENNEYLLPNWHAIKDRLEALVEKAYNQAQFDIMKDGL